MDYLWTPWRYAYITTADKAARPGVPASLAAWPGDHHCVFCNLIASIDYAIAHGMSAEAGMPEEAQRFHPVTSHGDSIAEAIEEERGNL